MEVFNIIDQGLLTLIAENFNIIDKPSEKRLAFYWKIGIRDFELS